MTSRMVALSLVVGACARQAVRPDAAAVPAASAVESPRPAAPQPVAGPSAAELRARSRAALSAHDFPKAGAALEQYQGKTIAIHDGRVVGVAGPNEHYLSLYLRLVREYQKHPAWFYVTYLGDPFAAE